MGVFIYLTISTTYFPFFTCAKDSTQVLDLLNSRFRFFVHLFFTLLLLDRQPLEYIDCQSRQTSFKIDTMSPRDGDGASTGPLPVELLVSHS